jgi:hypothetical protein
VNVVNNDIPIKRRKEDLSWDSVDFENKKIR